MSSKKYLLLLVTLLFLASCGKEETEVTTEIKKENPTSAQVEMLWDEVIGSTVKWEENPTPIPVSTQTKEGISTRFVNPKETKMNSTGTQKASEPSSLKVNKINKVYKTPGGDDEVSFSIQLDGNTIKNVQIESIKGGDISKKLQKSFWDAINGQIVWKTLDEAKNVKAVWGASLTTKAFVDVINTL